MHNSSVQQAQNPNYSRDRDLLYLKLVHEMNLITIYVLAFLCAGVAPSCDAFVASPPRAVSLQNHAHKVGKKQTKKLLYLSACSFAYVLFLWCAFPWGNPQLHSLVMQPQHGTVYVSPPGAGSMRGHDTSTVVRPCLASARFNICHVAQGYVLAQPAGCCISITMNTYRK